MRESHTQRASIVVRESKVLIERASSSVLSSVVGDLRCSVRYDQAAAQWVVELKDVRPDHTEVLLLEERFAELELDDAKAYHARLTASMAEGVRRGGVEAARQDGAKLGRSRLRRIAGRVLPWFGGAVIAFIVLQVMGVMMGYDEETMRIAQAQKLALEAAAQTGAAGAGSSGAPAQPTPGEAAGSRLTAAELARVQRATSLQLGDGKGKTLYVFSDPNCPSCQRIERALEEVSGEITVRIIPVAFQNGSEALTGSVLCAKRSQIAEAWSAGIKTGKAPGDVCKEGLAKVQANNALFAELGFTHTPTLVSESGALSVGDAQAAELRQWVQMH